ncbi:MAG: phosphoribosylaminoimidazolesuccinocarboxamide synthase [Archaeoglobaceae archaeon]|nr:phosphoribosylaminoimidazolesuccinocarboxamide synthase [Archaeoglobaceae archaeon]MDW7990143.1 phosphoribosylaminoimidazolesuccinocarboxamide synthase [Archaeoglobaceae archaeon]
MGSVKDLLILKKPDYGLGEGIFEFSNRYSVFDYGEMPDKIEGKGASLCLITAFFFEKIEEIGIKTHYSGLIEGEKVKRFDELNNVTNRMKIKLVRVIKPDKKNGYDYSVFHRERSNFLLPLEVIYRNKIPEGSSLLRRIEKGEVSPRDFGLKEIKVGMKLEKPIVDFSTKLEDVDRYLSYEEAKKIAGLSDSEFNELKSITLRIDDLITEKVSRAGLENEDGKIEVAFDDGRNLMIVDAVGTPDECRFSFEGFEVSKEFLRSYYRKTEWYERIKKFKGRENWREIVGRPPKLPDNAKKVVSNLYMSLCNEITGTRFFDTPKLKEVVKELREVL